MSIHRIGVTVASIVTVAAIGGAFVVQGYVAAEQAAAQAAATSQAVAQATANASPEIVYISPPLPTPAATPTPTLPPAPIIHIIVPGPGGDDGGHDD
jgi:hypothetical protein